MTACKKIVVLCCLAIVGLPRVQAQKQIALTFDDPNTYQTPVMSWQERNESLLKTLEKHHIQAALFVCGKRVDSPEGSALLSLWDAQGHSIANHTYSHLYYHATSVSSAQFIADFVKGDQIIQSYANYTRLFRFPYLKEGTTVEKRDSMRTALQQMHYRIGYVTVDASDWYIDAQLTAALKKDSKTDSTPYKEYYLQHILDRARYYHSLAEQVWKKPVKHNLLLHHSLLNALFLDDLIQALQAEGWQIIEARTAFEDAMYQERPSILPAGESIIWQFARQQESLASTLRYPAEDGTYEKEALEQYLLTYQTKQQATDKPTQPTPSSSQK